MTTNTVIVLGSIYTGLLIGVIWLQDLWRERPEQVRRFCGRFILHPSSLILDFCWALLWVPVAGVLWLVIVIAAAGLCLFWLAVVIGAAFLGRSV